MASRRLLPAVAIAVAFAATTPGAAPAASACRSAPGTSAIDQYCEVVPSAEGGEPTDSVRGGRAGASGSTASGVDHATAAALRKAGPDGQAVLALAGGTHRASTNGTAADKEKRRPAASGQVHEMAAPSKDPLKAISSSVAGGSTLTGALIPVLLLAGVGALGLFWRRAATR